MLREAAHGAGRSRPTLICDYDGTLAPFRENKMDAVPYPGIAERLRSIAAGPTRLAFVSGRPSAELITLLPLAGELEIWGMHGWEHRLPDGQVQLLKPTSGQRAALDEAQQLLEKDGLAALLERKAGSLAVHWRALEASADTARLREAQRLADVTFAGYAGKDSFALLPFDGGLELRTTDHTKGHAAEALLAGADARAAAFLGDDMTDEDAFQVLRRHGGLTLLVRELPRASNAHFSLHPPAGLLAFLDAWLAATAN